MNKKSTFNILFYLKKNAPKKNGKVTIMCRITINSENVTFSTKLEITSNNWDLKYGRVSGKSREANELNIKLNRIRIDIEECYFEILKKDRVINVVKLKSIYLGMNEGEMTFFKFFDNFLNDYQIKVKNETRVSSTYDKYKTLMLHLKSFVSGKYK